jgi:hypothetical protein
LCILACRAAADDPPSFEGFYESSFGGLHLVQEGSRVEGSYFCCRGVLIGEVRGEELVLRWRQPVDGTAPQDPLRSEGWVRFRRGQDRRLSGTWGMDGDPTSRPRGDWNAVRLAERRLQAKLTVWKTEGSEQHGGRFQGRAVLGFEGNRVSGALSATYDLHLAGERTAVKVFNDLKGIRRGEELHLDWSNPLQGSHGTMKLSRTGAGWTGRWQMVGDDASQGEIRLSPWNAGAAGGGEIVLSDLFRTESRVLEGTLHFQEGQRLFEDSRNEEAVRELQRAIALLQEGDNLDRLGLAYIALARSYKSLGRYAEARRACEAVLTLGGRVDEATRLIAAWELR